VNWGRVPGYFSITNFLYTVTEVFEFASRLAQRDVYSGPLTVEIGLKKVKGFVLTTELGRVWSEYRAASVDDLGRSWDVDAKELVSASTDLALKATVWFFERFGWLGAPTTVLQKDQEKFLAGRL
jgi:hypothetical protein